MAAHPLPAGVELHAKEPEQATTLFTPLFAFVVLPLVVLMYLAGERGPGPHAAPAAPVAARDSAPVRASEQR